MSSSNIASDDLLAFLSLYGLVGALLGIASLIVLVGVGYFAQPNGPFGDVGTTIVGNGVVLATVLVALAASFLMATLLGASTGWRRDDAAPSPQGGAVVGALGHVVLLVAELIVLVVGFAVLNQLGGVQRDLMGNGSPLGGNLLSAAFVGLVFAGLGGWAGGRLARSEDEGGPAGSSTA